MKILVTGGAGYIGTHTVVELQKANHEVVVVDNLINSSRKSLERVTQITGKPVEFHEVDLLDREKLQAVFDKHNFDACIHFAGLKAVGESTEMPLRYYHNNITGTLVLCEVLAANDCKNLVFSSSATVYGDPATVPITENFPTGATNPYGHTKHMIEQILMDMQKADPAWNVSLLRYFNPVGAHESGLIGEHPNGRPNNLMPFIAQVAVGKREKLSVFGSDYPTVDGTGVRDYIHVVDLSLGHLRALEKLADNPGIMVHNLGTGQGYSVLQMVKAFEKASGREVPVELTDRRPGDVAIVYADPAKAKAELGWSAEIGVDKMCEDTWRWQSNNPNGYDD